MNDTCTVAVDRDIIDLADQFLNNRKNQKEEWRKALAEGNIRVLRRLGHELRGTAGAFGFQQLCDLAAELERVVLTNELDLAADTLEEIIDFLERATVVPR